MAFASLKSFLARVLNVTPEQLDEWSRAWRVAAESGSSEPQLAFICRECGLAEDVFLPRLAEALGWPYLELAKLAVAPEAQKKISTKVAFQYAVIPTALDNGAVQVAISNPFDNAMLNAVRFDAKGPVHFAPRRVPRSKRRSKNTTAWARKRSMKSPRTSRSNCSSARTRKSPRATRRPASSVRQPDHLGGLPQSRHGHSFRAREDELRIRNRIDGILHRFRCRRS
jgi:hypothetical protein